jgi:exopolysaccharide biosynthesis polyprenyl glycosylphosphotransferase
VRRRALLVADAVAFLLAYVAACLVVAPADGASTSLLPLIVLPLWLLANKAFRQYDRDANLLRRSTLDEMPQIAQSALAASALLFMLAPLTNVEGFAQAQVAALVVSGIVLMSATRSAARGFSRRLSAGERGLIVGSGYVCDLVAEKLVRQNRTAVDIVGFIDTDDDSRAPLFPKTPIARLGHLEDFQRVCAREGIERVIVAFSASSDASLVDLVRQSKRLGLKVSIVPRLFEALGTAVDVDHVEGVTLLGLRPVLRPRSMLLLKRAVDVTGALVGLIVAAPVLLVAAIAVKSTSPGPVLYRQDRIGRGNRPFSMYKLRTMVEGAHALRPSLAHLNEAPGGKLFKIADDPRLTPVGPFLRRTSLDEVPQLLNVLRGEMSLVGPRPLVPEEDDAVLGWHRDRLNLTPGLTGPWQVLGRNSIPFEEMVRLDYFYVAEWSLWQDIKLLVRTLPVVVRREGQ